MTNHTHPVTLPPAQVLRRVQWEAPLGPRLLPYLGPDGELLLPPSGGAAPGAASIERARGEVEEAAAAMPSHANLVSAGRYDLHAAIVKRGGYKEAAAALGRQSSWPPPQASFTLSELGAAAMGDGGWLCGVIEIQLAE